MPLRSAHEKGGNEAWCGMSWSFVSRPDRKKWEPLKASLRGGRHRTEKSGMQRRVRYLLPGHPRDTHRRECCRLAYAPSYRLAGGGEGSWFDWRTPFLNPTVRPKSNAKPLVIYTGFVCFFESSTLFPYLLSNPGTEERPPIREWPRSGEQEQTSHDWEAPD